MIQEVWKLVELTEDQETVSAFVSDPEWRVAYKVGQVTFPKVKGSLLMAFGSRVWLDACVALLVTGTRAYTAFRCRAEVVGQLWEVSFIQYIYDWRVFWDIYNHNRDSAACVPTAGPPVGTFGCNWIEPLEEVKLHKRGGDIK